MKKKDFILIGGVVLLALLCWVIPKGLYFLQGRGQPMLRITVDGQEYGTYALTEDQKIEIQNTNVCELKDGKVNMIQADCPDKLCMHQGPADEPGETIVCLPNRVVLEIISEDEGQTDSIVR